MQIRWIAGAVIALTVAGCASQVEHQAAHPSRAADLAALAEYNKKYLQSINDGDIATLSRLTSDEHMMIPANTPPVVGKAANDAGNGRAFELNKFDERWNPIDTEIAGDWAWTRGTYTTDVFPKNGDTPRHVKGTFLRIYKRQPEGGWKMIRDMFSSEQQKP
jgi:ketosteroid isomerase-like protein